MTTSILLQPKTDENKAEEGVWFAPKSVSELEVCVRRAGNVDARRLNQKLQRKHTKRGRQLRDVLDAQLDPEVQDEVTLEVTCKTLFVDFRGPAAIDKDGKQLENTYENRVLILQGREALHDEILDTANDPELFSTQEEIEADSKNSSSSSKRSSKAET